MKRKEISRLLVVIGVLIATAVIAEVPGTMTFQGRLKDSSGRPVFGTMSSMTFSIYSSGSGGGAIWSETQKHIGVSNGVFNVSIGSVNPIDAAKLPVSNLWLGVNVGDGEMSPRQKLLSVPFAVKASVADSVVGGSVDSAAIANGSVTLDKLADTCAEGQVLAKGASGWQCAVPLGGVSVVCYQGDFVNCYTGPANTKGVGRCKAGERVCDAHGVFGACAGEVTPNVETCNGIDDDCNGDIDDVPGVQLYYRDLDGDGFGDPAVVSCTQLSGYVLNKLDCDDSKLWVNTSYREVCDGIDNDCNGQVDDACVQAACNATDQAAIYEWLRLNNNLIANVGEGLPIGVSATCSDPLYALLACGMMNPIGITALQDSCPSEWIAAMGPLPKQCNAGDTKSCGSGVGACVQGIQTCTADGTWGVCTGGVQPTAETLGNNIDENCDGYIDNACTVNEQGKTYACGWESGSNPTAFAACLDSNSVSSECKTASVALFECASNDCGMDMDCAKELCPAQSRAVVGFDCVDGTTISCGPNEAGVGECKTGIKACSGGAWGPCVGSVYPAPEVCDGKDNDCNGQIDENPSSICGEGGTCSSGACQCSPGQTACVTCTDTFSDPYNCGACGNNCTQQAGPNMEAYCSSGACSFGCMPGFADCDGNAANGCEAELMSDPANCGACGNNCASQIGPNAVPACDTNGMGCFIAECSPGFADCDGNPANGCEVNILNDPNNCGWCGQIADDGNACNGVEICMGGAAVPGTPLNCDDGNICTVDECDPVSGSCIHVSNDGPIGGECYTGPPDTQGVGACMPGTLYCQGGATVCLDEVTPSSEVCDGIDNNCNGQVDEGVKWTYYLDADGDGHGSLNDSTQSCARPDGYVVIADDCNDSNAAVRPGATEYCNGIDDNCDGQVDEATAVDKTTWYVDNDGDSYGSITDWTQSCSQPAGYVANSTDCNDSKATVHPGATEVCDYIDNNCNGSIDEGVKTTYYRDADGDGYGDPSNTTLSCSQPAGYVANSTDCNDYNAAVRPGASEVCDGIDNNCNGSIDEGVETTYYLDADGDGYGSSSNTTQSCSQPAGYVANSTDCNDYNAAVRPGASEVCDGIDNNCNGSIDEGVKTTYYLDADGDGYGSSSNTAQSCSQPAGYVANSTDCNDYNAAVRPGATEYCNGIDDNCNGMVDEGC